MQFNQLIHKLIIANSIHDFIIAQFNPICNCLFDSTNILTHTYTIQLFKSPLLSLLEKKIIHLNRRERSITCYFRREL